MKKILLVFMAFFALTLLVPEAYGGIGDEINDIFNFGGAVPSGEFELPDAADFGIDGIGANTSARVYLVGVLNFALSFLGLLAVAFLIYAGFLYVTAGGDDGQHEKAKKIVIFAAIGILVVLVSYALVNTLIVHAPAGTDDRDGNQQTEAPAGNRALPGELDQIHRERSGLNGGGGF
jgi:hypothetical protein